MAKADNALQEYWDDEEKCADLFHAKLFGGERVILPEHLTEADSRKTAMVKRSKGKAQETALMYRDLVKVAKIYPEYGVELVILGLENQSLWYLPIECFIHLHLFQRGGKHGKHVVKKFLQFR